MDILDLTSSHVEEDVFVWVRKGNPQLLIGLCENVMSCMVAFSDKHENNTVVNSFESAQCPK